MNGICISVAVCLPHQISGRSLRQAALSTPSHALPQAVIECSQQVATCLSLLPYLTVNVLVSLLLLLEVLVSVTTRSV